MKICFLILAHDQPGNCARLADRLLAQGAQVCLHADARAGEGFTRAFDQALVASPDAVIRADRVDVDWGQWSMVEATLNGLRAIQASGQSPDYVYLVSGADYPLRPLAELEAFLARHNGTEFIESVDARKHQWVTRGLQAERWEYRHWISWKTHPLLFDIQWNLQRLLGLRRSFPDDLSPHMGSQWWTLTWPTCEAILREAGQPGLVRFFRTTWVPDELFFQTLVRKVLPDNGQIDSRHLTLYQFNPYGVPICWYNDHADLLSRQPFFFARKLSPGADRLRDQLDAACDAASRPEPPADAMVGRLPPEYTDHLNTFGKGLIGRRMMLKPGGFPLGDLEWNAHPYFVIISPSATRLREAAAALDTLDHILCHGQLMQPQGIGFSGDAVRCSGYSRDDTAIRAQNPQGLVADLLNGCEDEPGQDLLTGYLLSPGQLSVRDPDPEPDADPESVELDMTLVHARDPRAILVLLEPGRVIETRPEPGAVGHDLGVLRDDTRLRRQLDELSVIRKTAERCGVRVFRVTASQDVGAAVIDILGRPGSGPTSGQANPS